ncbi:HAT, C-terminal dimerisation domain [Cinara cedri]|uniref:HAT, C-terminal dimerisation domain n=1 Tax=Cinara cedri TaxID=506608 RepID=A0A5E4MA84_9HEMI|nr:HAT, C-terminal dimerisation domain [Cinara cedri]
MFLDFNKLMKVSGISTDNKYLGKLKVQCDSRKKYLLPNLLWTLSSELKASFLELEEVYRRILIIPVSSATAERSFSTVVRRMKTYNRSIMTGKRLHSLVLALLSIEREKTEEFITYPGDILNVFSCGCAFLFENKKQTELSKYANKS